MPYLNPASPRLRNSYRSPRVKISTMPNTTVRSLITPGPRCRTPLTIRHTVTDRVHSVRPCTSSQATQVKYDMHAIAVYAAMKPRRADAARLESRFHVAFMNAPRTTSPRTAMWRRLGEGRVLSRGEPTARQCISRAIILGVTEEEFIGAQVAAARSISERDCADR
jgi:hypothetical protein